MLIRAHQSDSALVLMLCEDVNMSDGCRCQSDKSRSENVTSRVYEGVSKRQIMVESIGVAFPSSESQVLVFNLDDPRNFTDDGIYSRGAPVCVKWQHILWSRTM